MELTLTPSSTTQVAVTCNGQPSHIFDLLPLIPKESDDQRPQPLENPLRYGEAVFAALFPPNSPVRRALNANPERIVLVTDETLQAIPWEYAHSDHGFVAVELPFVRGLPKDKRIPSPELSAGLHILAVPSRPLSQGIAPLNIDGEWLRLTEIVGELETPVMLERVRPPTPERLGELAAGRRDLVVHFMGHGGADGDHTILLFEQENGAPKLTSARDFANLVRRKAFFVTLNACVSATPGATEFANLAAALVGLGVPYALGMRFSIVDDDSLAFSKTLYGLLARGEPVEQAVMAARRTLADSPRAWAVGAPVLYTALDQPADGFQRIEGAPKIEEHQPKLDLTAIPRDYRTFQGRIEELIALGGALTGDNRPRVLTIHAPGGQGKTALARESVERFGWAWPGGVWAITLETLPTRVAFVAALARFLAIDTSTIADPADIEKAVLARLNKRTLLMLDNAETLVEAVEWQEAEAIRLARFLREDLNGTRTHLLVTSRDVLGWPGEAALDLGGLGDEEGADLFRDHAPTRGADIDPAQARALSQQVGGHPLSLRLLAGVFEGGQLALSAVVADYEARLREAEDQFKDLDHRHRTIRAAIDTSARALSSDLRDLLSGLWLFHAPFLPETVEAIFDPETDYPKGEQSPVYDRLYQLWRRGLLVREATTVSDGTVLLYRLLPAVRLYAEDMPQAHERTALRARFGSAYAALASNLYRGIDRSGTLAFIAQRTADDLTRGLDEVEPEGETSGYFRLHRGWIAQRLGDRQTGLRLTEQALASAEGRYQWLESEALTNLAEVYRATGQPERARELYEQALPILRAAGERQGEVATLSNLALVYRDTGQPERARELLEQALPITREVGNRAGEAQILTNLGEVYRDTGQPERARELLEQALPITREIGNRRGEAAALNNLATVYSQGGEPERALEIFLQIVQICREIGAVAEEATSLKNAAAVLHQNLNRTTEAIPLVERSVAILKQYRLPQDAAGVPPAQHEQFLAQMRAGASPASRANAEQQVNQMVLEFLNAEDWDATRRVLEQHSDLLLGDRVAAMFEAIIAQAQSDNPQLAQMLTVHLALLRDAKANGIDAAFARLQAANPPPAIPADFVTRCAAALNGAPADKAALFGYLQSLPTDDVGLMALVGVVQRALFMSNPVAAPSEGELTGVYAETWQHILAQLKGDAP